MLGCVSFGRDIDQFDGDRRLVRQLRLEERQMHEEQRHDRDVERQGK